MRKNLALPNRDLAGLLQALRWRTWLRMALVGWVPAVAGGGWVRLNAVTALTLGMMLALGGCGGGGGGTPGAPTPAPPRSVIISGTVNSLAAGQSLTLQNNGADSLVVTADGAFRFATRVNEGAAFAVRVAIQPVGQSCIAERGTGTALADVTDIVVMCRNVPTATYRVGGTVSGLPGNGPILVLRNNRLDYLDMAVNGSFRFNEPVPAGESYAVVVDRLPDGQSCTVTRGVGTSTVDVTDVEVVCRAASATPPGGVLGMAGTWLNGVCSPADDGRSTKVLWRVTPHTDTSVAVSESSVQFANGRCEGGVAALGAFAPASVITVRRTASTATTTATWSHWTPSGGVPIAALWHWRRNELCLKFGTIGDATDPELALPTPERVEAHFATVSSTSASCFVRY